MSGERRYPDGTVDQPWWRYDGDRKAWSEEQDAKLMSALLIALERPDALTANILRLWPREQIVTFASHLIGEVRHQKMMEDAEECPDCKNKSVVCAPGGGVKCVTPGCGYWFCF